MSQQSPGRQSASAKASPTGSGTSSRKSRELRQQQNGAKMDTSAMTIKELKDLQAELYAQAQRDGILGKLALIAKELGAELEAKYGPKYQWQTGDIVIYLDCYGNFMTVHIGSRQVCSTHPCDRLYVQGRWVDQVLPFYADAVWRQTDREERRAERERRQLAAMLAPV